MSRTLAVLVLVVAALQGCLGEATEGCTNPYSPNFDPRADIDDGSCETPLYGCTDPLALNWDPDATADDQSCELPKSGCTDPTAANFDPEANVDDDTCEDVVLGCTDPLALNWSAEANRDDGTCILAVYGCTDPTAYNYAADATVDNGTCEDVVRGCTDRTAVNWDPDANTEDGSCVATVYGCTDTSALNFDPSANVDNGTCVARVFGCTDPTAFNYDQAATVDNGTCIPTVYGCTDGTAFNFEPAANVDDASCVPVVEGCTDPAADNHDADANTDDGSCTYPPEGCTDPEAVNHRADAQIDDGSCIYPYEVVGLSQRPPNGTCTPPDPEPSAAAVPIDFEKRFVGADLMAPVTVAASPVEDDVYYIATQGRPARPDEQGILWRVAPDGMGGWQKTAFLTLPDFHFEWEGGVLGLVLHPDFANNGDFFVFSTRSTDDPGFDFESALVRYHTDDFVTAEPDSGIDLIVLQQDNPFHQAGFMRFDSDGYLWASFGDGGGVAYAQKIDAQDPTNLFGTVIRIDVDSGSPYAIPPDNPWADGVGAAPEVMAYGFRNPWRLLFDDDTGDIYVFDVGQAEWEEISLLEVGGNHGWPLYEGDSCHEGPCDTTGLTMPLVSMAHPDLGGSVIALVGGQVWTSPTIPALQGTVVFGDNGGSVWALTYDGDEPVPAQLDAGVGALMGTWSEDGIVHVLAADGVYAIVAGPSQPPNTFPQTLSATGCFDPSDPRQPRASLIPYDIQVPLWSDGAGKERYLVVPDGEQITVGLDGDFDVPVGTMLFKSFLLDGEHVETRMMVLHDEDDWGTYSYRWREDQTDADLLHSGLVEDIDGLTWTYPSRSACFACHTEAAGVSLGPSLQQLNTFLDYGEQPWPANQLVTLDALGLLDTALPDVPSLDHFPSFDDPTAPPSLKARAYLHSNCSHCHQPANGNIAGIDLRWGVPLPDMDVCDRVPGSALGLTDARIVAPGAPERSVLHARVSSDDPDIRMPPVATRLVDDAAVAVIEAWIASVVSDCSGSDADDDGVLDVDDNCPLDANPTQLPVCTP